MNPYMLTRATIAALETGYPKDIDLGWVTWGDSGDGTAELLPIDCRTGDTADMISLRALFEGVAR